VDGKDAEELFFKPLQIGLFSGETPVWRDDKGQLQNDYAIIDLTDFLPELKEDKVSLRHILGGRVALRKGFPPAQSDVFRHDDLRAIYPTVGAEVFVLGYPRGIASTGVFPIWKRASIASEPQGTISLGGLHTRIYSTSTVSRSPGCQARPLFALQNPVMSFVRRMVLGSQSKKPSHFLLVSTPVEMALRKRNTSCR
jgi:hypothetical protein